jgi:hypothetical protein
VPPLLVQLQPLVPVLHLQGVFRLVHALQQLAHNRHPFQQVQLLLALQPLAQLLLLVLLLLEPQQLFRHKQSKIMRLTMLLIMLIIS